MTRECYLFYTHSLIILWILLSIDTLGHVPCFALVESLNPMHILWIRIFKQKKRHVAALSSCLPDTVKSTSFSIVIFQKEHFWWNRSKWVFAWNNVDPQHKCRFQFPFRLRNTTIPLLHPLWPEMLFALEAKHEEERTLQTWNANKKV